MTTKQTRRTGLDAETLAEDLIADGLDRAEVPTGDRLAMLTQFAKLYEAHGLLAAGRQRPIRDCCPNAASCWRNAPDGSDYGISLPWIGRHYKPGGVLVLGMNFNDASGLAMAFHLALWEQSAFGQGWKSMHYDTGSRYHSNFAYRSTRTAGLLLDGADGSAITDRADASDLRNVVDRIVRLQTVKCSPRDRAARGSPSLPMWELCPPLFLRHEIEIARPRYLIGFGSKVADTIAGLAVDEPTWVGSRLRKADLRIDGEPVDAFLVDHPAARGNAYWPTSHASLLGYLQSHQTREHT